MTLCCDNVINDQKIIGLLLLYVLTLFSPHVAGETYFSYLICLQIQTFPNAQSLHTPLAMMFCHQCMDGTIFDQKL